MGVSVNWVGRTSLVCGPRGQREWEVGQSPRYQVLRALTRLTSWEFAYAITRIRIHTVSGQTPPSESRSILVKGVIRWHQAGESGRDHQC